MELPLLILVLLGMAVGTIAGIIYRRLTIRRLRTAYTHVPEYQLDQQLSPVEFAFICEGKISQQAVLGQIISLAMSGMIVLERSPEGKVVMSRGNHRRSHLSKFEASLIPRIMLPYQTKQVLYLNGLLMDVMEYEAIKSLREKGWLRESSDSRPSNTGPIIALIVSAIVFVIGLIGIHMEIQHPSGEAVTLHMILAFIPIIVLPSIIIWYTFVYHMRKTFRINTRIARLINSQFAEEYHKVYGLYTYMKVSGLDTMTPDYASLDFHGLDKLYPYAVAAGLDPKLTRALG